MIEAVIDWVVDYFADRAEYRAAESRFSTTIPFSASERNEITSYDAMACSACQVDYQDNHIPEGKQVI